MIRVKNPQEFWSGILFLVSGVLAWLALTPNRSPVATSVNLTGNLAM